MGNRILILLLNLSIWASVGGPADNRPVEVKKLPIKSDYPAKEGYVTEADGVQLFYRMVGKGKDVAIFLHGGPGLNMNDGGFDLEPLAKGRTLLMYDQRGGGRSTLVQDPNLLTVSHHVRDLEALRQHFGIKRMTLIGLSWGSGLAALYATEHPERVDRLLLISPMPPADQPFWKQRIAKVNALIGDQEVARLKELRELMAQASDAEIVALCREYVRIVGRPYFVDPSAFARMRGDLCAGSPAALRNQQIANAAVWRSLGDYDFRPLLAKLMMPTLIVEGALTTVPIDATRAWAATMPNARLLLVPEAGHLHFIERPAPFFAAAERFLRGKWPKEARMVRERE